MARYQEKRSNWVKIDVNTNELLKLNAYLINTFQFNENGMILELEDKGYSTRDDFYKSKGSYSCFKTCNTWVNLGFKKSGLKSCLWTPFDFSLLNKYN